MSTQNQNAVVQPMGEIGDNYTAPNDFQQKVRLPGVQLLTNGNNLGVVRAIIDLGTHMESFNGNAPEPKRKVKVIFEHPQLKQLFYEGDTVPRSTESSFDATFNVGEKSNLRKLIHAVENRALTNDEANAYPLKRLLGARVNVVIQHTPGKKNPTKIYEKIVGITSPEGLIIPPNFQPENPYLFCCCCVYVLIGSFSVFVCYTTMTDYGCCKLTFLI